MLKIYTDAATNQKNHTFAAGILIVKNQQQTQLKYDISATDNHEAEFIAAIHSFNYLIENFPDEDLVFFYSDSKILIDSLEKQYSKSYSQTLADLLALQENFPIVINNWISDKENAGAHTLAIQALHEH